CETNVRKAKHMLVLLSSIAFPIACTRRRARRTIHLNEQAVCQTGDGPRWRCRGIIRRCRGIIRSRGVRFMSDMVRAALLGGIIGTLLGGCGLARVQQPSRAE